MVDIPSAPVKRILKRANQDKPVSEGAVRVLVESLEAHITGIGLKAAELARHRGGVTIEDKDIKLVLKNM